MNNISQKQNHIDVIPRIIDTGMTGIYTKNKKNDDNKLSDQIDNEESESVCQSEEINNEKPLENSLWYSIKYYTIPVLFIVSIIIIIYILYKYYTKYYKNEKNGGKTKKLLTNTKIEEIQDDNINDQKIKDIKNDATKYIIDSYSDSEEEDNKEDDDKEEDNKEEHNKEEYEEEHKEEDNKDEYEEEDNKEEYEEYNGDIEDTLNYNIDLDNIQNLLDSEETKEYDISIFDTNSKIEYLNDDENEKENTKVELLSEEPTPPIKTRKAGRPKKKI